MSATQNECPTVDQDVTERDFSQHPYPAYEEWRGLGPVVYNEKHDEYVVTGYRDCARSLTKVGTFSSQDLQEQFTGMFGGATMEALDSARHHAMRGIWAGFFERESLEQQRELVTEIVTPQVDGFVERVRAGEVVDAVPNLNRAIPTLVIARMLGIDESMHKQFSAWSDAMGATGQAVHDPSPRGREIVARGRRGTAALNGYLAEVIKERRAQGRGEDLVSAMVYHDYANEMSEQEIIASNTQLVFAGNETTASLMGTILVALARHPDQRRALTADRSLIPQAIEEIHRWETLVQGLPRRVISDDAQIAGVRLPRASRVTMLLAAGNRDPARWDEASQLNILREPRQHLGFGFGMHVCLGLNLARLELQVWLGQLLDKLPDYQLAGEIEYPRGMVLRAPLQVPVAA